MPWMACLRPNVMAGLFRVRCAKRLRLIVLTVGLLLIGLGAPAFAATAPIGGPSPKEIPLGVAPEVPPGAHDVGPLDSAMPLTLDVVLYPRDLLP